MDAPCTVFVRLTPLPGHADAVVAIIRELLPEVRSAQGCLTYEMFAEVSGEVMLYEVWATRADWQAHFGTAAIRELQELLKDKVKLPVERLETYRVG